MTRLLKGRRVRFWGTRNTMEHYGSARIRDQGATMIIIRALFSLAVLALAGVLIVALRPSQEVRL